MSWAAEVIADDSGRWVGNQLRFTSREEADAYVADLALRGIAVVDVRSVESPEPVNYKWVTGKRRS